jgi:hypothetical protein
MADQNQNLERSSRSRMAHYSLYFSFCRWSLMEWVLIAAGG